jgi:hypothetical protein
LIYKLKTDIYTDEKKFAFTLQIKDKDLLSSDDYLSSYKLPANEIKALMDNCILSGRSAKFYPDGDSKKTTDGKFTVETQKNLNYPNRQSSKLVLSIEIVTEEEAKIRPAGLGRGNPNQDPFLPEPIGRFQFSWNPFKLLVRIS